MKVFRFADYGGPEQQEFVELEVPTPGPGELLIRVRAAGVNPVDYKVRRGLFRDFGPRQLPSEFGSEVAGIVEQVGQDVTGFAVGDQVFGAPAPGHGAFSEYTVTSAATTAHKPPQLSFTDAAALPVAAATGYDGVEQLALNSGQTLLITGIGGGVGVAATQIARDRGIVVYGTGSEAKRALVESLDATLIRYGDGLADRLRELLPDGVHAIFDLIGGDSLRAVAGLLTDPTKLITAADPGTAAEFGGVLVNRDRTARVLDIVAGMVADGKLDPKVREVLPFAEAGQAIAAVESGHAMGKVVLSFD